MKQRASAIWHTTCLQVFELAWIIGALGMSSHQAMGEIFWTNVGITPCWIYATIFLICFCTLESDATDIQICWIVFLVVRAPVRATFAHLSAAVIYWGIVTKRICT
jgi:hypothetical protein